MPDHTQQASAPFLPFAVALRDGAAAAGYPSQRALGRAAGLAPDEVNRFFLGVRLPTLPRLAALVRAGIDPLPLIAAIPASIVRDPARVPRPN
jgi:hypothetical protein